MNGLKTNAMTSCSKMVELALVVGNHSWRLSQVGTDGFVPYEKIEPMDPCDGQIRITVDGHMSVYDVRLIYGVLPFDDETSDIPIVLLSQR